ncbi:MAG: hypothetical protein IPM16_21755 [Chloroflexi bacterium]|nr:hypothetical protein [Chloroflexota bacterium]
MTHLVRRAVVLGVLLAVVAAGVWAQGPSGGGTGGERPPLTLDDLDLEDFGEVLRNPQAFIDEFAPLLAEPVQELVDQFGPEIQANVTALEASVATSTVRYAAIVLGILVLLFARRAKAWSWLALGAVVGLAVAPLPLVDTLRQELLTGELSFLLDDPLATISMVVVGALAGIAVFAPMFYLSVTGIMALVGIALATQVFGASADVFDSPGFLLGVVGGFIAGGYVSSRSGLLVTLAIGAALIVFGLNLSPLWIVLLMAVGGAFAGLRSTRGKQMTKRITLPTLELQEGKVAKEKVKPKRSGAHLHDIMPEMADDRTEPLIRR